MTIFDTIRKMMLAGFGAQEKFSELIDELVKKGELSESQGAKLTREWTEKAQKGTADLDKSFGDIISRALEKMNIPTNEDLKKLDKKLHTLSSRVKKLEEGGGSR